MHDIKFRTESTYIHMYIITPIANKKWTVFTRNFAILYKFFRGKEKNFVAILLTIGVNNY